MLFGLGLNVDTLFSFVLFLDYKKKGGVSKPSNWTTKLSKTDELSLPAGCYFRKGNAEFSGEDGNRKGLEIILAKC